MRVMIIDDQPEVRNLLATVVKKEGHEVFTYADAAGAWAELDQKPALILADVDMPGETGVQFVMRLRSHPTCSAVPVMFVTAFRDRVAALVRADPAVVEVIDKPFRIETIIAALRKLFDLGPVAA
jgi:DNA-binding response OmpR family regulator